MKIISLLLLILMPLFAGDSYLENIGFFGWIVLISYLGIIPAAILSIIFWIIWYGFYKDSFKPTFYFFFRIFLFFTFIIVSSFIVSYIDKTLQKYNREDSAIYHKFYYPEDNNTAMVKLQVQKPEELVKNSINYIYRPVWKYLMIPPYRLSNAEIEKIKDYFQLKEGEAKYSVNYNKQKHILDVIVSFDKNPNYQLHFLLKEKNVTYEFLDIQKRPKR